MVLSGDSGVVSRSLVHRSFHIRNAHSDIMIRNRQEVPLICIIHVDVVQALEVGMCQGETLFRGGQMR